MSNFYNKKVTKQVRNDLYASAILMQQSIASGVPVGIAMGEVDAVREAVFVIEYLEEVIEMLTRRQYGEAV